MSEIVNTYSFDDPFQLIPMKREEFYGEQKRLENPTVAVEVVNVILFTEGGEMILQKRSGSKAHNPSLIDKAVGGHITNGDEADHTVMVETIQELQVPSIVLRDEDTFQKTYSVLGDYLQTIAVVRRLGIKLKPITKIIDGKKVKIGNKSHMYIGVYGGSVKNVDHEAKGILFYSLDELNEEMEKFPDLFTQDMHYYMQEYKNEIISFRDMVLKNS